MINNFRRNLNHKLLFAITFLLPVLLCLLIGVVHFGKSDVRVGILKDTTYQSDNNLKEVYKLLYHTEGIRYADATETSLNTDLITGRYQVVLDYRGSSGINDFHLISFQKKSKVTLIEETFRNAFGQKKPIFPMKADSKGMTASERNIAIMMSLFMVFSTMYSKTIVGDRQNGMVQRYRYARINSQSYIQGYLLFIFLIVFCQNLLGMGIIMAVQTKFSINLLECVLMSVIIAVISTLFGVLISVRSKSEVQVNIMASAITAILSLLGGTFVAVESMPGLLRILSFVSPIRWVVELFSILPGH
jgi:uncharacterized membrane protein (DUF485 family)